MIVKVTRLGTLLTPLSVLTQNNIKEVSKIVGESAVLYCYEAQEEHGLVLHFQDFTEIDNGEYDLPLTQRMFMEAYNV